jgi:hypothetical protein
MISTETQYRIYTDGTVVHEDDFNQLDLSRALSDDFSTVTVPNLVVDFIAESFFCSEQNTQKV